MLSVTTSRGIARIFPQKLTAPVQQTEHRRYANFQTNQTLEVLSCVSLSVSSSSAVCAHTHASTGQKGADLLILCKDHFFGGLI